MIFQSCPQCHYNGIVLGSTDCACFSLCFWIWSKLICKLTKLIPLALPNFYCYFYFGYIFILTGKIPDPDYLKAPPIYNQYDRPTDRWWSTILCISIQLQVTHIKLLPTHARFDNEIKLLLFFTLDGIR